MKAVRCFASGACIFLFAASCNNNPDNHGTSQPIDSTNVHGTAPAAYGPGNPANDQNTDSNKQNVNDTGTKANNVHNTGTDNRK